MSEEEKKAEVLHLFKEGAKPAPRRRKAAAQANQITVNGTVTGQIVGGDVHNHTYAKGPARPKIVVQPGVGVVTEEQKAAITALRAKWMALHAEIKKKPMTDSAAWIKINRAAGVTSYHQIPMERYDLVIKFIKQEMAKLRAMPSAPSKDDDWRQSRIRAIKARCTNQLGDPGAYKAYIRKAFSAESLTDLATDELRKTYSHIMAKKPVT